MLGRQGSQVPGSISATCRVSTGVPSLEGPEEQQQQSPTQTQARDCYSWAVGGAVAVEKKMKVCQPR